MKLLFIILLILITFFFLNSRKKRWINYGKYTSSKRITINEHDYYVEEVEFNSYQEALSKYFKVVSDISEYGTSLEVKYDLYDWTYSIFRFRDTTIEVRNIRPLKKIKLVKSLKPITIEEFQLDNAMFK